MAKRYIKIGWENKPSVKTPLNMTNLGRMDKGIDDCDNAIEEIYNKRVNNVVTTNEDTFLAGPVGKVLQDQVTELNKNLATKNLSNVSIKAWALSINANAFINIDITVSDVPTSMYAIGFIFVTSNIRQIFLLANANIYTIKYNGATWGNWYKFDGAII